MEYELEIIVDGIRWAKKDPEGVWWYKGKEADGSESEYWTEGDESQQGIIQDKFERGEYETAGPQQEQASPEETIHIIINGTNWRRQPGWMWEHFTIEQGGWIIASVEASREVQRMFEAGEYTTPQEEPAARYVPDVSKEMQDELREYNRSSMKYHEDTKRQLKEANERADKLTALQIRQTMAMEEIAHVLWPLMGTMLHMNRDKDCAGHVSGSIYATHKRQEYRQHRAGTRTLMISAVANIGEALPYLEAVEDAQEFEDPAAQQLAQQMRELRLKLLEHLDSEQLNKIYGEEPAGTEPETGTPEPETGGDQATVE